MQHAIEVRHISNGRVLVVIVVLIITHQFKSEIKSNKQRL